MSDRSVEITGDELAALDEALHQTTTSDISSEEFWKSIDKKMEEKFLRENTARISG